MLKLIMNFIFDFDGTICDSFDITIKILNEYLLKLKKPLIDPKKFRMEGIEEVIKDYKLNKFQQLIYVYKGRQELAKHIDEMKTFPKMTQVIQKLSKDNKLGIVSSNSRKSIERFLLNNNLASCFDFIYSSPTIFEKSKKIEKAIEKYNLDKSKTIYVGDEVRDIEAGKKAGLKVISVSWGFADKKLLKKYKPDYFINTPQELLSYK